MSVRCLGVVGVDAVLQRLCEEGVPGVVQSKRWHLFHLPQGYTDPWMLHRVEIFHADNCYYPKPYETAYKNLGAETLRVHLASLPLLSLEIGHPLYYFVAIRPAGWPPPYHRVFTWQVGGVGFDVSNDSNDGTVRVLRRYDPEPHPEELSGEGERQHRNGIIVSRADGRKV